VLTIIANVLAALVGVGITYIGVRGFIAPQDAAGFGIPDTRTEDPVFRSWLMVKAVRDIGCGLFLFLLITFGPTQLLGLFMLVAALLPLGDALIVWRSGGPKWAYLGVHGGTAAGMLVIGALLLIAA
jgi:hypothetical protein